MNFVTANDQFGLRHLEPYDTNRNVAIRKNKNDGESDKRSWNGGVNGQANDQEINALLDSRAPDATAHT